MIPRFRHRRRFEGDHIPRAFAGNHYNVSEAATLVTISSSNYTGWGFLDASNNMGTELPYTIQTYKVLFVFTLDTNTLSIGLEGNYATFPSDLIWKDNIYTINKAFVDANLTRVFDAGSGPGGTDVTYWSRTVIGDPPDSYSDGVTYNPMIAITTT